MVYYILNFNNIIPFITILCINALVLFVIRNIILLYNFNNKKANNNHKKEKVKVKVKEETNEDKFRRYSHILESYTNSLYTKNGNYVILILNIKANNEILSICDRLASYKSEFFSLDLINIMKKTIEQFINNHSKTIINVFYQEYETMIILNKDQIKPHINYCVRFDDLLNKIAKLHLEDVCDELKEDIINIGVDHDLQLLKYSSKYINNKYYLNKRKELYDNYDKTLTTINTLISYIKSFIDNLNISTYVINNNFKNHIINLTDSSYILKLKSLKWTIDNLMDDVFKNGFTQYDAIDKKIKYGILWFKGRDDSRQAPSNSQKFSKTSIPIWMLSNNYIEDFMLDLDLSSKIELTKNINYSTDLEWYEDRANNTFEYNDVSKTIIKSNSKRSFNDIFT